jgi:DTW domain-containing protein YfiP
MAHLCIQNSRLIQGTEFDDDSRVRELIADPQNHCVVLFPGANSIQIDAADSRTLADAFPENKTLVVFVIDGTWACAKRMVRRSRNLSSLQQICFSPKKESEYRIRKQPDSHCLSTIEAVHRILEILDPSVDPGILLQVFRTMVEQQISYSGRYKIRRVAADYVPTSSCSS